MGKLGVYHGATLLDETDLERTNNNNKIRLEYYTTKKHSVDKVKLKTFYGIAIVKKEYNNKHKVKLETNSIKKISTNKNIIIDIIETLKNNKVTPIALNDVLADLLKQPKFQES